MKKVSLLFNNSTFIDFNYVLKLIVRYKWINIFIVVSVFSACWYNYFSQDNIYLRELTFVSNGPESSKSSSSPMNFLSKNSDTKISLADLRGMTSSWEFIEKLTRRVVERDIFEEMVFFSLGKERVTGKEVILSCQSDMHCVREKVSKNIGSHFKIKKNVKTPGYTLRVHSFDEKSARILEKDIVELLNETRINTLSKFVELKVEALEKMLVEKKQKVGLGGVDSINERMKLYESEISDLTKSVKEIQFIYNREKAKLFEIDLKLKHLMKTENNSISTKDRIAFEKSRNLEQTIIQLRENIELLKVNDQKGDNKEIISKLQVQIKNAKASLRKLGKIKNGVQSFETLQKNKKDILPELVIDSKVIRENVDKLKSEQEELVAKRVELIKKKNELKSKLEVLGPDIEVYQLLKSEYSSRIMKKSTIVSDFEFEKYRPNSKILNTHSLRKISILSVLFSLLSVTFVTLLRFIADKNLYDKDEMEALFPDLRVLGSSVKVAI